MYDTCLGTIYTFCFSLWKNENSAKLQFIYLRKVFKLKSIEERVMGIYFLDSGYFNESMKCFYARHPTDSM